MSPLDTRVPAVLLRTDRNPFHHGTLGAVRSLGRAGVEVHLVADCAASPVRSSRFLRAIHAPPRPGARLDEFAGVLDRVADRVGRPAVLVALDDASAVAVARLRADLTGRFLLPAGPADLAEQVADKAELAALCGRLGLPHPATTVPDSAAEAEAAARELGLPVVAKWSRPWLLPAGAGLRSTVVVRSAGEAAALYRRSEQAGSRLILQAFLPPGLDRDWFFHGYVDHAGVVRCGGPGRKLGAWPPGAGLTTVGRWTPNPQVQALAERLTATLGYRGVFDLDFRREGRTDVYHLLDFNPRPGAQFRLFTDTAGVDVVRALHLDLTGRRVPDGTPVPGRTFVVENYAPLTALRPHPLPCPPSRPGVRELAWYARDDRAPGLALWSLWPRHALGRLLAPRTSPPGRHDRTPDEHHPAGHAPDPRTPGPRAGSRTENENEKASSA
nr:ATP-grasp domain-containing protein [Streptomyces sp. AC495_CC817]